MGKDSERKVKFTAVFDGTSIDRNGITTVKFKTPNSELHNYIGLTMLIALDTELGVKEIDGAVQKIGRVRFKKTTIDRDGDATIAFEGNDINTSFLNRLPGVNLHVLVKEVVEID